jgi:hypothetical protein
MRWFSNAFKSQQMRHLGVALATTGAAAAVAASAVLAARPESAALLQASEGAPPTMEEWSAVRPAHAQSRSPKDADRVTSGPWVKRARIEATAAHADTPAPTGADVSVPDAAEALRGVAADALEPAPTF